MYLQIYFKTFSDFQRCTSLNKQGLNEKLSTKTIEKERNFTQIYDASTKSQQNNTNLSKEYSSRQYMTKNLSSKIKTESQICIHSKLNQNT